MLKVFISYAREDADYALEHFNRIESFGYVPWLDSRKLLPGQNWEFEIQKALADANVVLLLLSPRSVSKRGFVQREANLALEKLNYKLEDDIYIIPTVLESCEVPQRLGARLQYASYEENNYWVRLKASLDIAAEQQQILLIQGKSYTGFQITSLVVEHQWHGCPGHDIRIEYPKFTSGDQPLVAEQLSRAFEGRAFATLAKASQSPLTQHEDAVLFSGTANGHWEDFEIGLANNQFVSVLTNITWYGARAAHPNSGFACNNYSIHPHLSELSLDNLFKHGEIPEAKISDEILASFISQFKQRTGEIPDSDQTKDFAEGAKVMNRRYDGFLLTESGIRFFYAPYSVSAYVFGSWTINIPYEALAAELVIDPIADA